MRRRGSIHSRGRRLSLADGSRVVLDTSTRGNVEVTCTLPSSHLTDYHPLTRTLSLSPEADATSRGPGSYRWRPPRGPRRRRSSPSHSESSGERVRPCGKASLQSL